MALQTDGLLPATLALLEALAGSSKEPGWFGGGSGGGAAIASPVELMLVQAAPLGARHYFVRNNAVKCRVQKPATTLSSFLAPLLKSLASTSQTVTSIERCKSEASSAGPQCMTAPQFRSWLGTKSAELPCVLRVHLPLSHSADRSWLMVVWHDRQVSCPGALQQWHQHCQSTNILHQ